MYTVLLVDDEKTITDFLKKQISWAELGVESVLCANQAQAALSMLKAQSVDLLITDIQMPQMDGFELLKQARKIDPDMHCILLTAYGEFDYAMQALRLGVDNYLLKPVKIQELTESVENALDNIYIQRGNKETLFRENLISRWLTDRISSEELAEKSVFTDINIYLGAYCAIVFKRESGSSSASFHAFYTQCTQLLSHSYECVSIWDYNGNYVILTGGNTIERNTLSSLLTELLNTVSFAEQPLISVGETASNYKQVSVSYRSACSLLENPITDGHLQVAAGTKKSLFLLPDFSDADLSPITKRVLNYITAHYSDGLSIKELCNELNVSASHMGYLFKKETDMYFNTYLLEFRMKKAVELLCHTGMKINDIAEATGYSTPNYFITSFKAKTGMSPLKYRETYGGNV